MLQSVRDSCSSRESHGGSASARSSQEDSRDGREQEAGKNYRCHQPSLATFSFSCRSSLEDARESGRSYRSSLEESGRESAALPRTFEEDARERRDREAASYRNPEEVRSYRNSKEESREARSSQEEGRESRDHRSPPDEGRDSAAHCRSSQDSALHYRSSQEDSLPALQPVPGHCSPPASEAPRRPILPPSSLKGRRQARADSLEQERAAAASEARRRREAPSLEAELRSGDICQSSVSLTSEELRQSRKELVRSPELEKEISFTEAELVRSRADLHRSLETSFTSEELRLSRKELGRPPEISFALGEAALYALARVPAPREVLTDLEDWERLSVLEAAPSRPEKEVVRRRGPPPGER